jgi:hypothetical protein
VLGNNCRVVNDPNRAERLALKTIRPAGSGTSTA